MELYVNSRTAQKKPLSGRGLADGDVDSDSALRPSFQALMRLLDMADPAWPAVVGVLREMADAGVEIDETAVIIAGKLGAHRFATAVVRTHPGRRGYHQATLAGTSDSIVYYARRGDLIKIGTTALPVMRFGNLMPDEILAFEPGTAEQEKLRHRQFDHLRCHGEYFRGAPELLEHIRQLRHLHGAPDPSWPTTATARPKSRPAAPALVVSGEMTTIARACARFGMSKGAAWAWARRGLIDLGGYDDRGHRLYYVEQIIVIRDRMAEVRRHRAKSAASSR